MIGICTEQNATTRREEAKTGKEREPLKIENQDPSHEYLIYLTNTGDHCVGKTTWFRKYFEYYANGVYGVQSEQESGKLPEVGIKWPTSSIGDGAPTHVHIPLIYVVIGGQWKAKV